MHTRTPLISLVSHLVLPHIFTKLVCTHGTVCKWFMLVLMDTFNLSCFIPFKPAAGQSCLNFKVNNTVLSPMDTSDFGASLHIRMDSYLSLKRWSPSNITLGTSTWPMPGIGGFILHPPLRAQTWSYLFRSLSYATKAFNPFNIWTGRAESQSCKIFVVSEWSKSVTASTIWDHFTSCTEPTSSWFPDEIGVSYIC